MKFRLTANANICLVMAQLSSLASLGASESPLAHMGDGGARKISSEAFLTKFSGTSAVDANGVRHHGSDYGRSLSPWQRDITKFVAPDYPDRDRILRHEGIGLLHVKLDLKTGLVIKVTVIQSTGFPTLDSAAAIALRQWRWKVGKWKEIEIGVQFNTQLGRQVEPTRSASS